MVPNGGVGANFIYAINRYDINDIPNDVLVFLIGTLTELEIYYETYTKSIRDSMVLRPGIQCLLRVH